LWRDGDLLEKQLNDRSTLFKETQRKFSSVLSNSFTYIFNISRKNFFL
jgi:hypothetical protein